MDNVKAFEIALRFISVSAWAWTKIVSMLTWPSHWVNGTCLPFSICKTLS